MLDKFVHSYSNHWQEMRLFQEIVTLVAAVFWMIAVFHLSPVYCDKWLAVVGGGMELAVWWVVSVQLGRSQFAWALNSLSFALGMGLIAYYVTARLIESSALALSPLAVSIGLAVGVVCIYSCRHWRPDFFQGRRKSYKFEEQR